VPTQPSPETTIIDVEFDDARAVELRRQMDEDTVRRYRVGDRHQEPAELTVKRSRALSVSADQVRATLLVVDSDDRALAHLLLRRLGEEWELKRLFVHPDGRGRGLAVALLAEAERRAVSEGALRLILQTGDKQPEAVALYRRSGYTPIPVYEPYVETMPDSLCFEKVFSVSGS
jgi:GNAT superfamily N-acetyltransferase